MSADVLDEPLIALLGEPGYYRRFGFEHAERFRIDAPDPRYGEHFQVRVLATYRTDLSGRFEYAAPFAGLDE